MNQGEVEESKYEQPTPVSDLEQATPEQSNQIVNEAEIQIQSKSPNPQQRKFDDKNSQSEIEEEDMRAAEQVVNGPETKPKAATFDASSKLLRNNTADEGKSSGVTRLEPRKLVPDEQAKLLKDKGANEQTTRQEKFAEFLRTEKLKKYKRVPRVYSQRDPVMIKCPHCSKERQTRTRFESTGTQWCLCIVCCWLGCYVLCCVPFCCKRCYNVRHSCRDCYNPIGESGV